MDILSSVSRFRLLQAAATVRLCFCGVVSVTASEPAWWSSEQLLDAFQFDEPFFDEVNRNREPGEERCELESRRDYRQAARSRFVVVRVSRVSNQQSADQVSRLFGGSFAGV